MRMHSILWSLITFFLSISVSMAQSTSCPVLVEQALSAVGSNCANLDRNSACYGFDRVDTTFMTEHPSDFFSVPTDRAGLLDLDTVRTHPLELENDRWGVAVLNVQANIPNTIPGQGVVVMLVGDSEVTNDVTPDDALQPIDPIEVITQSETTLHTGPSTTTNVRATIASGAVLLTDGLNPEGEWLRVINEGEVLWTPVSNVLVSDALATLPFVGSSRHTPMQAFTFTTGLGEPACVDSEPMIAVQSPENIKIDLTVNGIDIRVGSMVTFQWLTSDTLVLTVHRGSVVTVDGETIEAGESVVVIVDENGQILSFGTPGPATEEERQRGRRAQTGINSVAEANGWNIFEFNDQEPLTAITPVECGSVNELTHVVQPGDTLFAIALQNQASMPDIIRINGLGSPEVIHSGLELIIPNPGCGFVGVDTSPPGIPTEEVIPPVTGVDCAGFRLTSPLGRAPAEDVDYYWDPAPGATSYLVRFHDPESGLVATLSTDGPETSIRVNTGTIGVGGSFQWEVLALLNGEVICSTGLSAPLTRDAAIDPVIIVDEDLSFFAGWFCSTAGEVTIDYSGLPIGTTSVVINFDDSMAGANQGGTFAVPPFSGSQVFSGIFTVSNGSVTAQPSGSTEPLPGILSC